MPKQFFHDLAKLITGSCVHIEINQVGPRPFLKSLWLKLCYAYIRFRAVRDYDCFQQSYSAEIIRLRLPGGSVVAHPEPWENVFETVMPSP